jgi:hypothetical protein
MPTLYSYKKYQDTSTSRELLLPEDPETHQRIGTELATLDGVTYVVLPDGATLPTNQPPEIAASVAAVTLTPTLKNAIANASPHVALIRARVREKIREKFSSEDESGLLRMKLRAPAAANPAFDAYDTHVEKARTWAAAEKTKLGLA